MKNYREIDHTFLKKAIMKSAESKKLGLFPAGAIVVQDGKILSQSVSDTFPGYAHAECSAIDAAFTVLAKPLTDVILYASMEPCLMCLSRAYNAGIRNIVFAISRKAVPARYYEGCHDNADIVKNLNEPVAYTHVPELEREALRIVT